MLYVQPMLPTHSAQVRQFAAAPTPSASACSALTDVRACMPTPDKCPTDCVLSEWAPWSVCTASCTVGTATRSRGKLVDAADGGVSCSNETSQTAACSELSCVDCQIGDWAPWSLSGCDAQCGGGTVSRVKMIVIQASGVATACGANNSSQVQDVLSCNTQACATGRIFVLFSERRAAVDVVRVAFGDAWRLNMSATVFERLADGSAVVVTILGSSQRIDGAQRAAEIIAAAVSRLYRCYQTGQSALWPPSCALRFGGSMAFDLWS
jgi:hypothetical protein